VCGNESAVELVERLASLMKERVEVSEERCNHCNLLVCIQLFPEYHSNLCDCILTLKSLRSVFNISFPDFR
jgi:hypothetical protein